MAFTIKIYERNEYIYRLLRKRLLDFCPDAYIVNPYYDSDDSDDRFSNYTRVLYDPYDTNEKDINSYEASPLRRTEDGGIIDCAKLITFLRPDQTTSPFSRQLTGSLSAVIPFVYSDVRDRFIKDLSSHLSGADYNIRLDFTSRLRAINNKPSGFNMTSLLEACRSKKFVPEDILKYCNMDDLGFLTPGCSKGYDDVYDLGIGRSITLMDHAANLAHSTARFVNVIAVTEGFKTKELPELLCNCDRVFVLLPGRSTAEEIGAKDLISILTKALGQERIDVRYAEDILSVEDHPGNGRLAV